MTIQELEQKLNECQKALAELKESKKEGKWKPKDDEEYWFMDTQGDLMYARFDSENFGDKWRVQNLPIFKTHGQAHRYWVFMEHVKKKSYEFSKEEWEDENIIKYYIYFEYKNGTFDIYLADIGRSFGKIYFKTEEDAQYIIDNFKDELMEYFV